MRHCQVQCNFGGTDDLCKLGKEYLIALWRSSDSPYFDADLCWTLYAANCYYDVIECVLVYLFTVLYWVYF